MQKQKHIRVLICPHFSFGESGRFCYVQTGDMAERLGGNDKDATVKKGPALPVLGTETPEAAQKAAAEEPAGAKKEGADLTQTQLARLAKMQKEAEKIREDPNKSVWDKALSIKNYTVDTLAADAAKENVAKLKEAVQKAGGAGTILKAAVAGALPVVGPGLAGAAEVVGNALSAKGKAETRQKRRAAGGGGDRAPRGSGARSAGAGSGGGEAPASEAPKVASAEASANPPVAAEAPDATPNAEAATTAPAEAPPAAATGPAEKPSPQPEPLKIAVAEKPAEKPYEPLPEFNDRSFFTLENEVRLPEDAGGYLLKEGEMVYVRKVKPDKNGDPIVLIENDVGASMTVPLGEVDQSDNQKAIAEYKMSRYGDLMKKNPALQSLYDYLNKNSERIYMINDQPAFVTNVGPAKDDPNPIAVYNDMDGRTAQKWQHPDGRPWHTGLEQASDVDKQRYILFEIEGRNRQLQYPQIYGSEVVARREAQTAAGPGASPRPMPEPFPAAPKEQLSLPLNFDLGKAAAALPDTVTGTTNGRAAQMGLMRSTASAQARLNLVKSLHQAAYGRVPARLDTSVSTENISGEFAQRDLGDGKSEISYTMQLTPEAKTRLMRDFLKMDSGTRPEETRGFDRSRAGDSPMT